MKKLYNSMRSQKAAKLAGAFIFTLLMVQPQTPAYAVNTASETISPVSATGMGSRSQWA